MRQVVRHTPDGMVFINGDMALPGCERCRGRIDIQRYVTGMSVDASTEAGGLSATISMSIPRISGDQIFRDGYNKLYPGLEVHIYMRGYFPTTGFLGAAGAGSDLQLRESSPYLLENAGGNIEWDNVPIYPYYPVFHGVITNVSHDYSGGEYHATLSCASLLHFWQYQNMNTEGAHLANKPDNSQVRSGMTGTNYNNTHPFAMIYNLYKSNSGAAGGVAYAHAGQSNLDGPLDSTRKTGGKQAWTHVTEYWEQRFRSRIQNLRMYGVNGNLFNAAQQAFLGQRGKDDLQNLLKHVQFAEDGTLSNVKDPFSKDIAVAKALGFERSGFDFIWSPRDRPKAASGNSQALNDNQPASINLLDMYAYTHQNTDNGQMQLYESTYETKLQIAHAVIEVTGYEFYQDVDGDLVFKPPFYNLDTSSNRIYRIEDIDIISISFTHSEPAATWIRVKPTYNKGATGYVGNDGALTRESKYADWKLVAQFGWRPTTLEITYTTDVRAAFLIGIARLDLLNIGVNSAQVTIPLRPEMRPGIPVYVVSEDTFYYGTQLAHGLTYGSQCTTTIQLTCRRRKFFAPGLPEPPTDGQDINDLIVLNRTDYPPRPIQVHENGIPRLAGFPNVVMALDPTLINPKFLAVGAGLPHLDSTEDVRLFFNFIRQDLKSISPAVFQEVPSSQADDPEQAPNESTQYRMQVSENEWIQFSINDLHAAYNDLQNARKEVDRITKKIEDKRNALWVQSRTSSGFQTRGPSTVNNSKLAALNEELLIAKATLGQVQEGGQRGQLVVGSDDDELILDEGVPNGNLFQSVIEATRMARGKPARRSVDGIPGSDVLASQLDMLENLKSSYTGLAVPGHYRYYSASHPNPNMQGQPAVFLHDRKTQKKPTSTGGTGGGAKPAAIPPPTSLPQSAPVNTDGETPDEALASRLKAAGITWLNSRQILWYRGHGNTEKLSPGVPVEQVRTAQLSVEETTNLVNIAAAGQLLQARLLNNQLWKDALAINPKFKLQHTSSWRPFGKIEGKGKQSQHALGKAIDCLPSDGVNPKPQTLAGFSPAYSALVQEAQKLYNEGVLGGLGLYPSAGFVHIDVRSRPGRWAQWINPGGTADNAFYAKCEVSGSGQETTMTPLNRRSGVENAQGLSACTWWQQVLRDNNYPGADVIKKRKGNRPNVGAPEGSPAPPPPPPPAPVEEPPPKPPDPPPSVEGQPITLVEIDLEHPHEVRGFVPPTVEDPELRPPEADYGIITATKGLIIARGPAGTPQIVSTDQIQTMRWSQFRMTKNTSITGDSLNGGEYSFKRKWFKKNLSDRFFNAAQETDPTAESTPNDMFKELWDLIKLELSPDAGGPLELRGVLRYDPKNPTEPEEAFLSVVIPEFTEAVYSNLTVAASGTATPEVSIEEELESLGAPPGVPQRLSEEEDEIVFLDENGEEEDEIIFEDEDEDLFNLSEEEAVTNPIPTRIRPSSETFEVRIDIWSLKSLRLAPQYAAASGPAKRGKKGQSFNATLKKLSDAYADVLAEVFSASFDGLQNLAMKPSTGRQARLSRLTGRFDLAADTALNVTGFKSTEKGRRTIKVEKFGTIGSPIHVPVRPISDAEGYEHFGSYRYGRGLTIDPGGTFAWLHNSDDPFGRLSAQAAEELVQALTTIKGGKGAASKKVRKAAQAAVIRRIDAIRDTTDVVQRQEAIDSLPPEEAGQAQTILDAEVRSRAELQAALSLLMSTQGESVVNELLSSNPASDGSVEVIDVDGVGATQLERKFSNFSASYTKSGPFKTSVSNAAYRLVDLTNHLQHPDMQACSCKGSTSDVALAAFGRLQFAQVAGIDNERSPAEAFVAEEILTASVDFFYQQKALRGEVLNPNQTPNASLFDNLKSQIGTALSGVRNGFVSTKEQFSNVPEEFRQIGRDFRDFEF
jgi:hypothetical protein